MISVRGEMLHDLEAALGREWLETNGLGGFASSTVVGANTRRYHGLLVAAMQPPVGRVVLLSKLEEVLTVDGERYELGSNEYPGVIHPAGYRCLREFRLDPFPVYTYRVGAVTLEKIVFLVYGENTVAVEYRLTRDDGVPAGACSLTVRPLVAFRDYHSLTHRNDALDGTVVHGEGWAICRPYLDRPALYFGHSAEDLQPEGEWYFNFEYRRERERGLDFNEDLFQPFTLTFDLTRTATAGVIASTERHEVQELSALREKERRRRENVTAGFEGASALTRQLVQAADQYLVERAPFQTVIAGYHWFTDWGRDTMIALHGLVLTTGRFDLARSIFLAFAEHVSEGMLPNRFADGGETVEYNTVDATLWFFEAIRAFIEKSGDFAFVEKHLYSVLVSIITWHKRGTRFHIKVDEDGLLNAGEAGVQLTWMDAKIGDWVVTQRRGKAVEIQALWYNALRSMEQISGRMGHGAASLEYAGMAERAKASFNRLFWNEEKRCLYDVVDGSERDSAIRPNQVFAVSLPFPILAADKVLATMETVERELLTRCGLRTLAASDAQYRGRCEGGPAARDSAYHQGTVWPWLFGPFVRGYLVAHGRDAAAMEQVERWLAAYEEQLGETGLGHISEIFDGDAPHTARGCIAQAWSVAEILRTSVELSQTH